MATRSHIGIKNGNSVRYVYCHYDGYPEHNGRILLQNYTTVEKVNELIDGGDLSILGENVKTDLPHSFKKPVDGVCVYYGRDRGEKNVVPKMVNIDNYHNDNGVDYHYLFDIETNKWTVDNTDLSSLLCKCD